MGVLQAVIAFFGRICLSLIFIISGLNKIFDWQSQEEGVVTSLCNWHSYMEGVHWGEKLFEYLLPLAPILLGAAVFFEILGGALVFIGYKVRLGAFLLILFLLPVTVLYHPFWVLEGAQRDMQVIMFLKNLTILGGALTLLAFGSGRGKKSECTHSHAPPPAAEK